MEIQHLVQMQTQLQQAIKIQPLEVRDGVRQRHRTRETRGRGFLSFFTKDCWRPIETDLGFSFSCERVKKDIITVIQVEVGDYKKTHNLGWNP